MFSICEGLLITILGVQLVLFFIAWQFAHFSQCLQHYIRQVSRHAIAICCHASGTFDFTKSKMDWWTVRWAAVCTERWNGGNARCAGARSLPASAAKTPWKARCIGRGRPSQTVLGKSIHHSSDWRSGWCWNRETICPLRGKAWGGDDEDAGVCSAPDLCGCGIHVFPTRNRPALVADLEASIPTKEAESKDQEHADKRPDVPVASQQLEHNHEGLTNWTWIIGACLVGALIVPKLQQTKSPASGPAIKLPADKPPDAKQLKVSPDPLIME